MKKRTGFVSNSSSSSFIIDRSKITYEQDLLLGNLCSEKDINNYSISEWKLFTTYGSLIGYTEMDNFDMQEFFDKIGISKDAVYWAKKEISNWLGDNPNYYDLEWYEKDKIFCENSLKKLRNILKELGYEYQPKECIDENA